MGTGGSGRESDGQNLNWYVFDNTLSHATDIYVNRMVNGMVPAGKKWLKFAPGASIPENMREEIELKLHNNTEMFFKYIHESNFQLVIGECFYDLVVSTGFMVINRGFEDKSKIIFASMPVDKTYAAEGPYGSFDAYFRDWHRLPRDHAKVMWPGIVLPALQPGDEDKPEMHELEIYEIIYKDYDDGLWHQVLVNEKNNMIMLDLTHAASPMIGFRAKKLSDEVYGRGPAMDAYPSAGTINQAMFDEIMSANFRALPMYMGFGDGVFNPNNFRMVPNTILSCSPVTSGTWPLQPVPAAGDINFGSIVINDLREQINKIMMADPLGAPDDPRKTATEIIERQREVAENASATYSRIQRELFDPLVDRVIEIMRQNGDWLDPVVDGKLISVVYETPLVISQGQKEVLDFLNFDSYNKQVFGVEASSGFYKMEEITPWMATKLNIDPTLVKNTGEIIETFQMVAEQQAMMQQQEQQQGAA